MNVLRKNVARKNTGSGDYLIRPARCNRFAACQAGDIIAALRQDALS
jgi:hypothetical protein